MKSHIRTTAHISEKELKPTERPTQTEELDSKLSLHGFQPLPADLEMASIMADGFGPHFKSRFLEVCGELEKLGYELSFTLVKHKIEDNPFILVTARNPATGEYCIPNVTFADKIIEDEGASRGGDSKEKKVLAAQATGGEELEDSERLQTEVFSPQSMVRLAFFRSSDFESPCDIKVQYSAAAFEESFGKIEGLLKGESREYCHLYHDILLSHIMHDVNERSGGYAGLREIPEINAERSYVDNIGRIHVSPFVRLAHGSEGETNPVIQCHLLQDDDTESVFPIVF